MLLYLLACKLLKMGNNIKMEMNLNRTENHDCFISPVVVQNICVT